MGDRFNLRRECFGAEPEEFRPSLGAMTHVGVYRMLYFSLRNVLKQEEGHERADALFREAGYLAGQTFYEQFCATVTDISSLVRVIENRFKELGIGIFRMEDVCEDSLCFTLTVEEDLDCSGLEEKGGVFCVYSEGWFRGIFESFTDRPFSVKEIDCWGTGAKICRFRGHATK